VGVLQADLGSKTWRDDRELWEREYKSLRVIPSTTRQVPSKAFLRLMGVVDLHRVGRILDAGCGNGRNALHLARLGLDVVAVDLVDDLLTDLLRSEERDGVSGLIHPIKASLRDPLPFRSGSFDLVVDSYVSCHFVTDRAFVDYWAEMRRVLASGGLAYTSQFSVEDAYYATFARGTKSGVVLATDPANGVTKRLFTKPQILSKFGAMLSTVAVETVEFEDVVQGVTYDRSVIGLLLDKGEHSVGVESNKRVD
jgi:SAM-dependent methyltransferase